MGLMTHLRDFLVNVIKDMRKSTVYYISSGSIVLKVVVRRCQRVSRSFPSKLSNSIYRFSLTNSLNESRSSAPIAFVQYGFLLLCDWCKWGIMPFILVCKRHLTIYLFLAGIFVFIWWIQLENVADVLILVKNNARTCWPSSNGMKCELEKYGNSRWGVQFI